MKISKSFKTLLMLILILFSIICFVSCESSEPNDEPDLPVVDINYDSVNFVIDLINDIGTVTLKSKSDIDSAREEYNQLNEDEKELITNYNILETAENTIAYLEQEDKHIAEGYDICLEYIKTLVPDVIEKNIYDLNLPNRYTYQNDYSEYIFILTWSTDNTKCFSTTGAIYHMSLDVTVQVSCEISCLKIKEKASFSKSVTVLKNERLESGKPIVISYYYGSFTGLTETDQKTIDVINYSFAQIATRQNGTEKEFYINVNGVSSLDEIISVHQYGIRVVLSLGGWHDDSTFWNTYSEAASTDKNRKMVAQSILYTMEKYQLDGIDMDWEYPGTKDKTNFSLLMKEIYITLKEKDENYIISGAFPYGSYIANRIDIPTLNNYIDYYNLMTYDMDYDGTSITRHMCEFKTTKDAITVAQNYGISKNKIVIGMAFYSRIYYGVSSTNNGLGQTCTSRESANYKKIKEQYLSRVGTEVIKCYDKTAQSYYLYDTKNSVMVSYEGVEGIKNKYNYSYTSKIAGVMYWSQKDDSTGDYVNAIYEAKCALDNPQA